MLKFLGVITFVFLGTSGLAWTLFHDERVMRMESEEVSHSLPTNSSMDQIIAHEPEPKPETKVIISLPRSIHYNVPFTSQAPTAEWGKQIFQDGCEEASVLMVKAWRDSETLTRESAFKKISALAIWQIKKIGHSVDTDVADTRQFLLEEYLDVSDTVLQYDFTLDELIDATQRGIVIVPTNGRKLGNPNFKNPGPLQHMLVIVGYDAALHEFITNDPGTRKGEGYRYPEAILYAAIRDYPTGVHLPNDGERKALILVLKEQGV